MYENLIAWTLGRSLVIHSCLLVFVKQRLSHCRYEEELEQRYVSICNLIIFLLIFKERFKETIPIIQYHWCSCINEALCYIVYIYFHCKLLHRVFSILPIEEIKFIRYRVFLAMFIPRKFQKPRNFSFSCQLYNRGNKPRRTSCFCVTTYEKMGRS